MVVSSFDNTPHSASTTAAVAAAGNEHSGVVEVAEEETSCYMTHLGTSVAFHRRLVERQHLRLKENASPETVASVSVAWDLDLTGL